MQKNTDKHLAPHWDDIRYFNALVTAGSLSAAARRLGVEHSTVARRTDALEASLGIRLFDRYAKGWVLTPEGETLAQHAAQVEQEVQAFSRAVMGVAALKGRVRISAPPVMAGHLLVPKLAALRARWQHIDLEVMGDARDANLARGEADMAIRMSRPSAPGLVAKPIGLIGYGLYAAPAYTRRAQQHWEFLAYDDSDVKVPQQQWLNKVAGERPSVFKSNDLMALQQAARAGLGLAVLPHFLAESDPGLKPVSTLPCPIERQVWLVMHPDVRRSPRVRLMADLLVEVFRQ
ncbi:MAG TPA: LysR family transcriptional regulator [Limnobacter sp.]|uniref:LysR family transcriptional regulator n=1 Tax=Limnobacter sp. TaxID=2003368 RepID=UPI002EDA48FC